MTKTFPKHQIRTRICLAIAAACMLPTMALSDGHADIHAWHGEMVLLEKPGNGCFAAKHPNLEWVEVDCVPAPETPHLPTPESADGTGNGKDYSALVVGNLTTVTGSFEQIQGVTSLTDKRTGVANSYTLQLNTGLFETPACVGSICKGWQQYVYESHGDGGGGLLYIQYWLINYGAACPSNWYTFDKSCYRNSQRAVGVPPTTYADLGTMKLSGSAESGGNDHTSLTVGPNAYAVNPPDNVLDLAGRWAIAEFNIFGNCCLSEAVFNTGSRMDVRTTVHYGSLAEPTCVEAGFTGETNNLIRSETFAAVQEEYPAIVFTQRNDDRVSERDCIQVPGTD